MSHLSTERLAALGDESPTPSEASHLAVCAECARERAAYRALVAMAHAERDALGLPLSRWESIASALAADGAPDTSSAIAIEPYLRSDARQHRPRFRRMPLQAAAAVLLLVGGVIAGRASSGAPPLPPAPVSDIGSQPEASVNSSTTSASLANADSVRFVSIEEARLAQLRAEAVYQRAAAFLAEYDSTGAGDGSPMVYRSRLTALDQMEVIQREAMRQAPHDPVINGYYLTTLGQREATLRQLNAVLPASLKYKSH